MRAGLVAKKIGMSCLFDSETGRRTPVTLLASSDCCVVSSKTQEKHGYTAVQLGFNETPAKKLSKPLQGVFAKNTSLKTFFKKLVEFRVSPDHLLSEGRRILPSHFSEGVYVDVTAVSKGKGFQGPMKRHNFGGLRASHGVSISHRSHGSTGQRSFPGRVFKNKKMAGQMGAKRVTHHSLLVMRVDDAAGLIAVKGSVPGPKEGIVMIRDAVKRISPKDLARQEAS